MEQQTKGLDGPITPQTRIGEIIDRWPQTVAVLVSSGFAALADPKHQAMVKGLPVTLEMACGMHAVNLQEMLERLNTAVAPAA